MARRPFTDTTHTGSRCPDCHQLVDNPDLRFRWSGPVVHCAGSSVAWHTRRTDNPHHGHRLYPACWKCHRSLGCDQCAGIPTEVLCMPCAVWGTPEALAAHGPMLNTSAMVAKRRDLYAPALTDYPWAFRPLIPRTP